MTAKKTRAAKSKQPTQLHLMDALLQKEAISTVKKSDELDAAIVKLSRKNVTFDLGGKAHAVLGNREVKEISTYLPYLKEGDTVRVRIISEESKEGFPVVSLRKFFEKGKWEILKEKKDEEENIEVVCGEYGKGGVFVDFMGIRGVIPKIQLTSDYLNNPDKLENQKIKVRVLEVDEVKNRLVVSQKASALNISHKDLKDRFDKIEVGGKYKAKVLGVSEFGVFCEVEGVEGLVHISEISWEKVTDTTSYVRQGEAINVIIVEKNEADLKLNLSIKRFTKDPWEDIEDKYPKDKSIEGEIVRKEPYGYFVRLEPGVEGLIHVSKLADSEPFKLGQKITVFVERINTKSRKMSLLLPQTEKPIMYR